jgi:hypothetical protein
MGTIRFRFICVALVVSFFAVGMAAFLNYFKYKSTIGGIAKTRALLVGRGIENSVQASLQIGMQFAELSQLNQLMQRERTSDRLVRGIDVFDPTGQILYSTEASRVGDRVPARWTVIGDRSTPKNNEWSLEGEQEYVAGIALRNSFNLMVGHIALRYSRDEVDRAASIAGREILLAAIGSFLAIALVAPLALIVVIRRFERDLHALEAATTRLEDPAAAVPSANAASGAFGEAITQLRGSLAQANQSLDELRGRLDSAG